MNPLDETDRTLLEILNSNGRLGATEIGRRINLSQPAVTARIKRLEESGVITGYRAVVDHSKLGVNIHAVIRLRTTHANIAAALKMFERVPEIGTVQRLTGEDCFLIDVRSVDSARLEAIVDSVARFGPVTTSLVLRTYETGFTAPYGDG